MYSIEADKQYSTHVGMVHGVYVDDSDRQLRTVGWRVFRNGRQVMRFRLKREAQAYVARMSAEKA